MNGVELINRHKNREALKTLGLTKANCETILLSLSKHDYCSGPEADRDLPGDVWIFGQQIGGKEIYIKLKMAEIAGTKIAKCISFHEAEFPLNYPYC